MVIPTFYNNYNYNEKPLENQLKPALFAGNLELACAQR